MKKTIFTLVTVFSFSALSEEMSSAWMTLGRTAGTVLDVSVSKNNSRSIFVKFDSHNKKARVTNVWCSHKNDQKEIPIAVNQVDVRFLSKCNDRGYGELTPITDMGVEYVYNEFMTKPSVKIGGMLFSTEKFKESIEKINSKPAPI